MTTTTGALALTTSNQQLAACATGNEVVVFGLVFVNTTSATRTVTLSFYNAVLATTTTVPFDVPAKTHVPWDKPIGMQPNDTLGALADATGVSAVFSLDTDTGSSPVASGFTPRGVYASGTTYAVNDLVSYSGSSYASAVAGNVGHQPDTSPTQWTLVAAQGATGAAGGVASTRQLFAAGLITGGGDLSADRTITVTAATAAEVAAGTSTTKANTPASLAGSAAFGTLTDASTVAWDIGTNGYDASVTLGGNRTIGAPTGLYDGCPVALELIQDSTGSRIPSFNAIFEWGAAGTPTLQTAAGKADFVFGIYRSRTGKVHANFRKGA